MTYFLRKSEVNVIYKLASSSYKSDLAFFSSFVSNGVKLRHGTNLP